MCVCSASQEGDRFGRLILHWCVVVVVRKKRPNLVDMENVDKNERHQSRHALHGELHWVGRYVKERTTGQGIQVLTRTASIAC